MHDLLVFIQTWSPHIWMFGSVFGVMMSATLLYRVFEQRIALKHIDGSQTEVSKFWFRHGWWFFMMHMGFLVVGVVALLEIKSDWANLLTLLVLVATPLVLVYRSYDSLRLDHKLRQERVNGRDGT